MLLVALVCSRISAAPRSSSSSCCWQSGGSSRLTCRSTLRPPPQSAADRSVVYFFFLLLLGFLYIRPLSHIHRLTSFPLPRPPRPLSQLLLAFSRKKKPKSNPRLSHCPYTPVPTESSLLEFVSSEVSRPEASSSRTTAHRQLDTPPPPRKTSPSAPSRFCPGISIGKSEKPRKQGKEKRNETLLLCLSSLINTEWRFRRTAAMPG